MAVRAIPGRGHMVGWLAESHRAVVAGSAVIYNTDMIKHPGSKRAGLVTDTAILGGGNVIHRFADGGCAMARRTVTHDTRVIKHRTNKSGGVMTDATILCGGNVCRRLANGCRAVVAGSTIVTDIGVVEYRG